MSTAQQAQRASWELAAALRQRMNPRISKKSITGHRAPLHHRHITEGLFYVLIRDPSNPAPGRAGLHCPQASQCFGGL